MANLLDIGKSGLLANRNALGVTSENIANANTEGYHRRIATSVEMLASQATATTKSNGGQGVKIDEIIRSFDKLLSDRLRTVSGSLESSQSFLPYIEMLEDRLTPGLGGLTEMLDGFFDAFGGLSLAPDDRGLRNVAMEAGRAFAATVSETALSMETMTNGVKEEAAQHTDRINSIFKDLSEIHSSMVSVKDTGVRNPILDRRDLLTSELGEIVDINVDISSRGTLTVTLGASPGGPVLVKGDEFATVSMTDDMFVAVDPHGVGNVVQTRRPGNGILHGLYNAVDAIQETLSDFDTWAQSLMTDMNAEHEAGLDLNNQHGGKLFSMEGWSMSTAPINKGTASAVITVEEHGEMPEGPLRMVYDGAQDTWTTYDATNTAILESSNGATFPGLTIEIDGEPQSGDVFFLDRTTGQAVNFRFALEKGDQLALASDIRIGVDAGNAGSGSLVARAVTPLPESGQTDLSTILTGSGSGVDAVEFLQPGVVGSIPSGTKSIAFASMSAQSKVQFDLGTQAVAGLTSLDVTLPSGVYSFDLTTDINGQALAPFTTLEDVADALNTGVVGAPAVASATEPITLSSLGISSAGGGTFFTLSSAGEDFQGASTLTSAGGALASTKISDPAPASDIILFTREGRQISGTPLSQAEAAALLTPANGFFESAVYNAEALNKPDGYRGIELSRSVAGGDYVSEIGLGNVPLSWSSAVDPAPNPSYDIQLWMGGRDQGSMTIPTGASAERTAQMLDDKFNIRADTHLNRCFTAIYILQSSLDYETGGELATSLFQVYEYSRLQVLKAFRREPDPELSQARTAIQGILSAWEEIGPRVDGDK